MKSNREDASPLVRRYRVGLVLLVVVSTLITSKTMSAPPDTDRSLNADKPATEPKAPADAARANEPIRPMLHPAMVIDTGATNTKARTGDNASPDISTLTRDELEAKVKALTESLTAANTESEFFRQQWQDLRLRDEALGVTAVTADEGKLQDRVVQAVAELYRSEMKRREALQLLDKLLNTTGVMIQTAPNYDPKVRADYEVASRAAKDYLIGRSGASIPLGSSLTDGKISHIDPKLNSVVVNLGKSQGVKEGMPFVIFQDNQQVGTIKVVLARDLVSIALVEKLMPKTVLKVGDRVIVDAAQ